MKIEAYACQHCESIYKTQQKAVACEKKCVARKQEESLEEERLANLDSLVHYVRLNAESVEDVCRMSEEVSQKLFPKESIKKMTLNIRYNQHASNSHSEPIGQRDNWGKKPDRPTGYQALTGTIRVVYNKEPKGFSSSTFNNRDGIAGICTGSGGYQGADGGYTVGYSVTLWLDDFPKIKQKIEEQMKANDNYAALKDSLYSQYAQEVESDLEIPVIRDEVGVIQDQINELQQEMNKKITLISTIKKERYADSKQLILDEEYARTENPFGIGRVSSNLTGGW